MSNPPFRVGYLLGDLTGVPAGYGVGYFGKRFDEPPFVQPREVHLLVEALAGSGVQFIPKRKQEWAERPKK
jgi:hypothetical protein